jgi:hypothetical protein
MGGMFSNLIFISLVFLVVLVYFRGVFNIIIPLIISSRKTDAAAYGILAIVIKSTVVILSMNEITVTAFLPFSMLLQFIATLTMPMMISAQMNPKHT